jgi:serine-type D-Ala-D-Ala carboxypeptidase/endopeptidase
MRYLTRRAIVRSVACLPVLGLEWEAALASTTGLPTTADVQGLLTHRIDVEQQSLGMIVALVSGSGRRVVVHGVRSAADSRPPTADSLFNLGSIAKVFTAILLADAVRRGEMRMDDPAQRYLPGAYSLPEFGGRQITLTDLVTHTSGLPTAPDDFPPETDLAAQAAYGREQLASFLKRLRLTSVPGTHWNYSNFNYALLGEALAFRTGTEFRALMSARVLQPLELRDTYMSLESAPRDKVIPFHDLERQEIPQEPTPALRGFGGMYSCAGDLSILVSAFMGIHQTPLSGPMAAMLRTTRPIGTYPGNQALGPQIYGDMQHSQIGHAGSTSGHSSAILWDPAQFGVVVLSNTSPPVMDVAFHLLDPRLPLSAPMHSVHVDPQMLMRFVGRYDGGGGMVFVVALEGGVLTFENPGFAPKIEMVPESEGVFTVPRVGARISFEGEAFQKPQSIHIELAGTRYTGKRMPE